MLYQLFGESLSFSDGHNGIIEYLHSTFHLQPAVRLLKSPYFPSQWTASGPFSGPRHASMVCTSLHSVLALRGRLPGTPAAGLGWDSPPRGASAGGRGPREPGP